MAAPSAKSRQKKPARSSRNARPTAPQHPGMILAEVLGDTPPALAAKWFGLTPAEMDAVLAGKAPMTVAMAETAGTVFETGAAPWLDMIANAEAESDDTAKTPKADPA